MCKAMAGPSISRHKTARTATAGLPDSAVANVERAAAAMRLGLPVFIAGADGLLAYAVETAPADALQKIKDIAREPPVLALTHARAQTLKIPLYRPDVTALAIDSAATLESLRAIADPVDDLSHPLKGPFTPLRETVPADAAAVIKLAKLAGLLPAAIVARAKDAPGILTINAADIQAFEEETIRSLTIISRARVPLEGAENSELVAFRPADGGPEHYAIMIGAPPAQAPVLLRLHSECFTGDLLGSLRCDCGAQLRGAIQAIAEAGGGVVLYLAQEGRGIGLINKLRAYRLQDQGFDTLEANERLGFARDERLYGIAARMLQMLGYRAARLMTNNPNKIAALAEAGIEVVERIPHRFPGNAHNRRYLATKAEAGHLL